MGYPPRIFVPGTSMHDVMLAGMDPHSPVHTLSRAYGEMVDVLWKDGKADAAIRLEMLWNGLAQQYGFALLCGYAMGAFYKQTERFEEVCRQHTHVMPPDTPVAAPRSTRRFQ